MRWLSARLIVPGGYPHQAYRIAVPGKHPRHLYGLCINLFGQGQSGKGRTEVRNKGVLVRVVVNDGYGKGVAHARARADVRIHSQASKLELRVHEVRDWWVRPWAVYLQDLQK